MSALGGVRHRLCCGEVVSRVVNENPYRLGGARSSMCCGTSSSLINVLIETSESTPLFNVIHRDLERDIGSYRSVGAVAFAVLFGGFVVSKKSANVSSLSSSLSVDSQGNGTI